MRWDLLGFWVAFIVLTGLGGRIVSEVIGRAYDYRVRIQPTGLRNDRRYFDELRRKMER